MLIEREKNLRKKKWSTNIENVTVYFHISLGPEKKPRKKNAQKIQKKFKKHDELTRSPITIIDHVNTV
jgi:hypothetical protein